MLVVLYKLNAQSCRCSSPVTGFPDSFATLLCIRFLSLGLKKTPSEGEGQNQMLNSFRLKSPRNPASPPWAPQVVQQ